MVDPPQVDISESVELDFSHARDVYEYRNLSNVEVVMAVRHTFGDDESRRLVPPRRRDDTLWTIETDNVDLYRKSGVVNDGGENEVATVRIKTVEYVTGGDGRRQMGRVRRENGNTRKEGDLLLTLDKADTRRFKNVSNEDLTRLIVNLGIGTIKRAVQMQPIRGTREPSGNKYVILENVKEEDRKKIPSSFDFSDENGQINRMWINYNGKPRRCKFCGALHDADVTVCPLEVTVRQMEQERENTPRTVKTYSDSTLRLVRQTATASDVDAMSGGTTGNVLNAIEVDKGNNEIKNLIIVAGQNELHRRMSNEEFLWVNRSKEERLKKLSETKRVAVLSTPDQQFMDPISQAREEVSRASLVELNEAGSILLWENPIQVFEADFGRHPSDDQTKVLMRFMDKMCREVFNAPFILDSATDEVLVTGLYRGVNSLYKFGCSGCNSRVKNKWQNLCDVCSNAIAEDGQLKTDAEKLAARADEIFDLSHPPMGNGNVDDDVEMTDILTCEACNVTFKDGQEIRHHFDTKHAGTTLVLPTGGEKRKPTDPNGTRNSKIHKNDS